MAELTQAADYRALSVGRLEAIMAKWRAACVAVVGDFFLDRYLIIDPELTEPSLETGLDAFQVVATRPQPGAAGTVTNNLAALGVQRILAIGAIGDDGEGYELRRELKARAVDTRRLLVRPELMTPTYTKPLVRVADGSLRELNRLDFRNREPTSREIELGLIQSLQQVAGQADAIIVADQEELADHGSITTPVVRELERLAQAHAGTVLWADSRGDISRFRHCIVKPNVFEACRAARVVHQGEPTLEQACAAGEALLEQTDSRAVVVTLGDRGVLVIAPDVQTTHVPAVRVQGEIDIVGAGDSATAGMVSALCAGATLVEAALIGNLVASITIQQLGTTGTASPEQVLQRLQDVHAGRVPGT
ncbi:MAG: bifunctional heptose 7-phosphate kinase/heptose 1-phosphate adenyltransferase [Armatimonadota bacterium]